jgi:hypothetical protein
LSHVIQTEGNAMKAASVTVLLCTVMAGVGQTSTPASAQPTKVGGEFVVVDSIQTGYLDCYSGDAAGLPNDGFVITYLCAGGNRHTIFGKVYDQSANVLRTILQTPVSGYRLALPVAAGNSGRFLVSWSDIDSLGRGNVLAKPFNAAGESLRNKFKANEPVKNYSDETSSVAALVDGSYVVAWTSYRNDGRIVNAVGRRIDSNGVLLGSQFDLAGTRSWSHSAVGLPKGGFAAIWSGPGTLPVYKGRVYTAAGKPAGAEFDLSQYRRLAVAAMNTGGFVVIGLGNDSPSTHFGQRYSRWGTPVGTRFDVPAQASLNVAGLSDGSFVTVGTSGTGVFGQLFDAAAQPVGGVFRVDNPDIYRPKDPSVAPLSSGGFVVSWSDYDYYAPVDDEVAVAVKGQIFAP